MIFKKQTKQNYKQAVKKAAGIFSGKNHPEWKNINSIIAWMKKGRKKAERY